MALNSAVFVQHANKSYGNKEVLKDLSMRVGRGTIYGLLGASGCGKTTLLSCIVGMKQLNSGDVWVLGGKPGTKECGVPGPRVGYMPQEIALVGEFTVKDSIYYFGRIFGLPENVIEDRFLKLSTLLDLPPADRYIKNCSGGQQRRVSFAAAMVHKPELLILDEPTVGVDPVLRERIWDYLVEVTNEGHMSVIITTHYIEEARKAHTIGLMRDGKLLAEDTPNGLLNTFQTDSLEEVFLILSRRQEEGRLSGVTHELEGAATSTNASVESIVDGTHASTDVLTRRDDKAKHRQAVGGMALNKNRLKALMDKNWKQFYRNLSGVAFILLFPILEILAFLLAVGADVRNIPLGIVNDETMTTLCPNFTKTGSAVPYSFTNCHFNELSCRFLTYLEDPMIQKIKYESLPLALEDITHGKLVGVLYMAENFTSSFEERVDDPRKADSVILDFSEIKVWLDMSNRQIGEEMKYRLYNRYIDFQKDMFKDCNYNPKLTEPINLETIYGAKDENYTIYMVPGIVLTILFFMGTVTTSQIILNDRCEGVWDRSTVAGVSSLEITLTHFILQVGLICIHTIEVFIITFLFFKINFVGRVWIMMLLAVLQGVAGMSYGFWVSIVSYNHSMANIVASGSFYPMILLGGLVWPIEGMPIGLQWISKCLPFTIAITSFRNVMSKGMTLKNLEVMNGVGVALIWIIGFGIISIYSLKNKQ